MHDGNGRPSADPDFAHANGWDRVFESFRDRDLPAYVGSTTFRKLPLVTDPAALAQRRADAAIVGAPFDDAVSHRPGARFGPRAIRQAYYGSGEPYSLPVGVKPFEILDAVDAGDANIIPAWIDRSHAFIYRKIREVALTGAIPFVLGGDHSITWPSATAVAEVRRPGSIGIVHLDAHADTASEEWGVPAGHGTPMRRLIESGAVKGRNFVQVGLRGYWPPPFVFDWMQAQGMRWHLMREIEERGAEAVIQDAIAEALDGADAVYLSLDVDVIDPGMAPGTGVPEPGGMLTREVLRAVRQIAGAVDLAGMDVVEVSPPYDVSEITAAAAHRAVMEALSALAAKKAAGQTVRFERTGMDRRRGRRHIAATEPTPPIEALPSARQGTGAPDASPEPPDGLRRRVAVPIVTDDSTVPLTPGFDALSSRRKGVRLPSRRGTL